MRRIRVSSCGVVDVLMYDTPQDMHLLQLEDLTLFGRLVFALCTGNVMASSGGNFQKSLEVMGRMYTPEIKSVALFLVNKGGPHKVAMSSNLINCALLTPVIEHRPVNGDHWLQNGCGDGRRP